MTRVVLICAILALGGCGGGGPGFLDRLRGGDEAAPVAEAPVGEPLGNTLESGGVGTAEEFDTTTAEERAEATDAGETAGARELGRTIASLGSPSDPGFWIETPLVTDVRQGRLEYPANGKTVNVELRPSGGAAGSGSRVSLPALRVLEAPLTGLPELRVFAL